MQFSVSIYIPGTTPIHRLDARVKLVLLLAYSVTLFFVHTWTGLGACVAACLAAMLVAKIPPARMFSLLVPVYVILAFTLVFNSFAFDIAHVAAGFGAGDVSAGVLAGVSPVPLIGSFGFVPEGFARGAFYALRIVFLIAATSLLTYTTPLIDIVDAVRSLLRPLARLKVPVEDVAVVCALTIRFIPSTVEEAERIMKAQRARGLRFDEGSLLTRAKAWVPIITPLFINLFRRADTLACAMDARCYTGAARTHLCIARMRRSDSLAGALGVALLACVAVFL